METKIPQHIKAKMHNHPQDTIYHHDCPRCRLNYAAPALLEACKAIDQWPKAWKKCDICEQPYLKEHLPECPYGKIHAAIALAENEKGE